jgi:hypothetical protein
MNWAELFVRMSSSSLRDVDVDEECVDEELQVHGEDEDARASGGQPEPPDARPRDGRGTDPEQEQSDEQSVAKWVEVVNAKGQQVIVELPQILRPVDPGTCWGPRLAVDGLVVADQVANSPCVPARDCP